ncbi:MAG: flagellar basal body P-ring protein FlgI [Deltaproteobacteria bacterium]|nr:flagellar basal body P-ring protein FlgI [Deltaproteobacteria bacterium]
MKTEKLFKYIIISFMVGLVVVSYAYGARIKDIASIGGVRDNQLHGYGLVIGLDGTGDSVKNGFTDQTLANMLTRQGLAMKNKTSSLKADNVAAVMVTAKLPAFAKIGTKIDVMVSSIGDADSLLGGTLPMTSLVGADGRVYATAQGPMVIGGFSAGGSGAKVTKNHTTVGRIPNGASVERELKYDFVKKKKFTLNLHNPDFTTCERMAKVIRSQFIDIKAEFIDSGSITVYIKDSFNKNIVDLISIIENLDVSVDSAAVVVMNEKTGTIVMGENVRISTVAVAHGNLSIQIREDKQVSQPLPFAPAPPIGSSPAKVGNGVTMAPGGQTVVTTQTSVGVSEEKKKLMVVHNGVTIQEVVTALNAIGVSSRDLIDILQTIKAAGVLQAELKII